MKRTLRQVVSKSWHQLEHYLIGLTKRGSHQKWMTFFVVGTGLFLFYLIYLATLVAPDIELVEEQFTKLEQSYNRDGIEQFLRKKALLKKEVARTLRVNKSHQAQIIASNISLYLYPDLLPEDDFEKEEALKGWAPFQKQIEANPGTTKSRIHFEEMRATIWNYENPDRSSPHLSETAREVLEIYNALSAR